MRNISGQNSNLLTLLLFSKPTKISYTDKCRNVKAFYKKMQFLLKRGGNLAAGKDLFNILFADDFEFSARQRAKLQSAIGDAF